MIGAMLYDKTLHEARDAAEKIDAAQDAVRALADLEPQQFPSRARLMSLRRIARELSRLEQELTRLYA